MVILASSFVLIPMVRTAGFIPLRVMQIYKIDWPSADRLFYLMVIFSTITLL